ncbi:MAG: hypothetical protein ABEI52_09505, partial [Halobacteriaceae archaeon]
CLKCFNRWKPRKQPKDKPQCSNKECKSRLTVERSALEENIRSVQRAGKSLPFPLGDLLTPPDPSNIPQLFESSMDVLGQADPRFPDGVDVFHSVLLLADRWDSEQESLSAAVDRLAEQRNDQ